MILKLRKKGTSILSMQEAIPLKLYFRFLAQGKNLHPSSLAHLTYCFGLDQEYGCCGTSRNPPQ